MSLRLGLDEAGLMSEYAFSTDSMYWSSLAASTASMVFLMFLSHLSTSLFCPVLGAEVSSGLL